MLDWAEALTAARQAEGDTVTVIAMLKNTEARAATEVAQCYLRNTGASLERTLCELKGFALVKLQPGEERK